MNASTLRTMVVSIGVAVACLATACGTARADDDHHGRHDHYDRHDRGRHEGWDRDHRDRYQPPPVVVAPPPQVLYEPPPLVVSPSPGVNIILPLNF